MNYSREPFTPAPSHTSDSSNLSASAAARFEALREGATYLPRLLALLVLAIYAPAIVCAGLLIALTSPGPAFVKKAYRRGNGSEEVVYLYELRTECWRTWQPTPMGKFMALCDVHRLPRLLNVLQGHVNVGERVQRM